MERIRSDLSGLVDGRRLRLHNAIEIMLQKMRGIKQMHDRGIIHGDLHTGNVVIMSKDNPRIGFIDFCLAFSLYSTYESDGYRASYRHDVFRAVLIGSILLNRGNFMNYCRLLADKPPESHIKFKNEEFLFIIPNTVDRFEQHLFASSEDRIMVEAHLQRVLDLVHNVPDIRERPPYHEIIFELRAALKLMRPRTSTVLYA